jgi:hypothetical protein
MSALIMYQGLEERFKSIQGLTNIILGEPTAIQSAPALYTALVRFERTQHGQVTAMRYMFVHRLVIQWQDNPQAEMQLLTLLNAIPASVDVSPTLGGRIVEGLAKVTAGDAGYARIGDVLYRICDFTGDCLEKAAVRSGL